jgi:hypothetical protein
MWGAYIAASPLFDGDMCETIDFSRSVILFELIEAGQEDEELKSAGRDAWESLCGEVVEIGTSLKAVELWGAYTEASRSFWERPWM